MKNSSRCPIKGQSCYSSLVSGVELEVAAAVADKIDPGPVADLAYNK